MTIWFTDKKPVSKPPPKKGEPSPLKILRDEFGLNQEMAAEALDVTQPMIAQVERSKRPIPKEWDARKAFEGYTRNRKTDQFNIARAMRSLGMHAPDPT